VRTEEKSLLVGAREAAALLGVSRRTLAYMVERGVIEQVRIQGMVPRYRRQDIERLAEKGSTA
jgi:excisionase family DNA binding protein